LSSVINHTIIIIVTILPPLLPLQSLLLYEIDVGYKLFGVYGNNTCIYLEFINDASITQDTLPPPVTS